MQIKERREDVLVLLTKGMKGYEIAKELDVDASTVSLYRFIKTFNSLLIVLHNP
jgi:DNA-binding NarL/FixJ family response regulator